MMPVRLLLLLCATGPVFAKEAPGKIKDYLLSKEMMGKCYVGFSLCKSVSFVIESFRGFLGRFKYIIDPTRLSFTMYLTGFLKMVIRRGNGYNSADWLCLET